MILVSYDKIRKVELSGGLFKILEISVTFLIKKTGKYEKLSDYIIYHVNMF